MKIEGWKAIAEYLESAWGRTVSKWAAMRYAKADDPLPFERRKGRIVGDKSKIIAWALRN